MNRGLLLLVVIAGCAPPRQVVREPSPPRTQFGEYITVPGQYVAKTPSVEQNQNDAVFFPTRTEAVKPTEHVSTLLTPVPVADPPLVAALREYMDGRTDKAIERIHGLDAPNQELILRLLPALVHASRADFKSSNDAAVLASQLDSAAEATAKLAALKIRKACFVSRVAQFGVFEPVPEKHPFLPGGAGQLYLELQNAPCEPVNAIPAGGKGFVTRLECTCQILDSEGKPIGAVRKQPHIEYMRSPVRDYFLKIEFEVPQNPGNYTLLVELRDPATDRRVPHTRDLIVAPR